MLLPILFGGWAWFLSHRAPRFDAHLQPHKLGGFYMETQPTTVELYLFATKNVVRSDHYVFDLKTRQQRYAFYGNITGHKDEMWELIEGDDKSLSLQVSDDKTTFRYDLPAAAQKQLRAATKSESGVRFYAWDDKVGLLTDSRLYRWKKRGAPMLKPLKISTDGAGSGTVDEKRKQVIYTDGENMSRFSATDGKLIERIGLPMDENTTMFSMSDYGRIVCLAAPIGEGPRLNWKVYQVAPQRALWEFETETENTPSFFSDDNTLYYLAVPARKIWEVRDAKTGEVVRTLPLVGGARGATLAPDGKTLYCVAGSSLYQQRAR